MECRENLGFQCVNQFCACQITNDFRYFYSQKDQICKQCPSGFKANAYSDIVQNPYVCYSGMSSNKFDLATSFCAGLRGSIVTIRDEIEKAHVDKILALNTLNNVWVNILKFVLF